MPRSDDRTPGLANALFGPRLGRPVFVAARTSTPLPKSVTDPATNLPVTPFSSHQFFWPPVFLATSFSGHQLSRLMTLLARRGASAKAAGVRPAQRERHQPCQGARAAT